MQNTSSNKNVQESVFSHSSIIIYLSVRLEIRSRHIVSVTSSKTEFLFDETRHNALPYRPQSESIVFQSCRRV